MRKIINKNQEMDKLTEEYYRRFTYLLPKNKDDIHQEKYEKIIKTAVVFLEMLRSKNIEVDYQVTIDGNNGTDVILEIEGPTEAFLQIQPLLNVYLESDSFNVTAESKKLKLNFGFKNAIATNSI